MNVRLFKDVWTACIRENRLPRGTLHSLSSSGIDSHASHQSVTFYASASHTQKPYHLSIASLCSQRLFFSDHLCKTWGQERYRKEKERGGGGTSCFFPLIYFSHLKTQNPACALAQSQLYLLKEDIKTKKTILTKPLQGRSKFTTHLPATCLHKINICMQKKKKKSTHSLSGLLSLSHSYTWAQHINHHFQRHARSQDSVRHFGQKRGTFFPEMPKKCHRETAQARRQSDTSTQTHISYHAYLWQRREGMRERETRGGEIQKASEEEEKKHRLP